MKLFVETVSVVLAEVPAERVTPAGFGALRLNTFGNPEGVVDTEKLTAPERLLRLVTVIVDRAEAPTGPPWYKVRMLGLALML